MDYKYWNEYYKKNIAPNEPSKFAKDILKYLDSGKKLIELGCGNGRDAMFLANNNSRFQMLRARKGRTISIWRHRDRAGPVCVGNHQPVPVLYCFVLP